MSFWSGLEEALNSDKDDLVEFGNQTYNNCKVWWHAVPNPTSSCVFRYFKGKQAKELILPLRLGISRIETDYEYYKQFQPANGWGNLEQALQFLYEVLAGCLEYPEAYFRFNG